MAENEDPNNSAPPIDEPTQVAGQVEEQHPVDGAEVLADLPRQEAAEVAEILDPNTAGNILAEMTPALAATVITDMEPPEAAMVLSAMKPDDRVDVLQKVPVKLRDPILKELDPEAAAEVKRLLSYPQDSAGGIMTTEVTALVETLSVEQAIAEIRRISEVLEHVYYIYIIDTQRKLRGVLSMRDLLLAKSSKTLSQILRPGIVSVPDTMDQEEVARMMRRHGYVALPVVDSEGRLVGLITADDVADVAEEEATEDIQKIGGMEALDAPYLDVSFWEMVKKRGGWLSALFLGEMLTATAMGYFEHEIERAVVLSVFIPLIISSGGNSGSQASTLIVRSLALTEVKLRDWWRVLARELRSGSTLGFWLGFIGFLRIVLWQKLGWMDYGRHYILIASTVWGSLIGVVLFGSIAGSMLPFILRRFKFDPATSSAPFVATLVDVTGLVIYFTVALAILHNTLLRPIVGTMLNEITATKVQFQSSTQMRDWTGDSKIDGIEALLEFDDVFKEPVKAPGTVNFDLFEAKPNAAEPEGQALRHWEVPIATVEEQQAHWNRDSRTYTFQLPLADAPAKHRYVLKAEFRPMHGEPLVTSTVVTAP